jgi:succinate dehydrogenase/fumarate reductase flavoprotein subunit
MARHPQRDNEPYSDDEAERRFMAAVKAGLNTKPKPLKSITPLDAAHPALEQREIAFR